MAMPLSRIALELDLVRTCGQIRTHAAAGSVLTGAGVVESMEWLITHAQPPEVDASGK
jgi:hypothetical protein